MVKKRTDASSRALRTYHRVVFAEGATTVYDMHSLSVSIVYYGTGGSRDLIQYWNLCIILSGLKSETDLERINERLTFNPDSFNEDRRTCQKRFGDVGDEEISLRC